MGRFPAAALLALRFVAAVATSGLQTVAVILRTGMRVGAPPPAAFVRVDFAPMSSQGVALLACMISLTPGTTVIDIDIESREMVVHMLDATQAGALVDEIRLGFEPGLVALFGVAR